LALKKGKEEIIFLLNKAIEKFQVQTGKEIVQNTNRKNYEGLAIALSEISNRLPETAETLGHAVYPADPKGEQLQYPFRKYDITGNQIKDAYFNQIVSKPRSFLVDACYIYLYGKGRKGFEADPTDQNLILQEKPDNAVADVNEPSEILGSRQNMPGKTTYLVIIFLLATASIYSTFQWRASRTQIATLNHDLKILPYKVSQAEIDSLEGIWLCYTGSPQARTTDPNRYHLVVPNIMDIKYKDGYFLFTRYGASFVHDGYMQFESPWLVSIHSYIRNKEGKIESPRHSLMKLDDEGQYKNVISASWSFDVAEKNNIIGIREVYIKQGRGGKVEEVLNTVENASCKCKIVKWHKNESDIQVFKLKNQFLDEMTDQKLKSLLDEESILLRNPDDNLIIIDTSVHK
jgi:hypothetical protein